MITTLTATTTDEIVGALLAEEVVADGSRVLTLIIATDAPGLEDALSAAHGASRDHPCRIIAVVAPPAADSGDSTDSTDGTHGTQGTDGADGTDGTHGTAGTAEPDPAEDGHVPDGAPGHLDAEIRVGHDAGAGETLVLRPWGEAADHPDTLVVPFLLPDVPVVTWWPTTPPHRPSTDPLGQLATTRITNAPALPDPAAALAELAPQYVRGDIDLAWTRITAWRATFAAALDGVLRDATVSDVVVAGEPRNASLSLMVRWLRLRLDVPVRRDDDEDAIGISAITAHTSAGDLVIRRIDEERVTISRPGGSEPQVVTMSRREPVMTMNEELRRLTPDLVFEDVLRAFAQDHAADGQTPGEPGAASQTPDGAPEGRGGARTDDRAPHGGAAEHGAEEAHDDQYSD